MHKTKQAIIWVTEILKKHHIPFQITGGLAAIAYGVNRPLLDIDIDIPDNQFDSIIDDVKPYIIFGPKRLKNDKWDLMLMTLNYNGHSIDLSGADSTRIFNETTKEWVLLNEDLMKTTQKNIFDLDLPVIPIENLIYYKKILAREVDLIDIDQIKNIRSESASEMGDNMSNFQNMYQLILEINKLKLVFRNTKPLPDRNESTAEHSWSVCMIVMILMEELKKEFHQLDELKIVKLALIHDLVEIYAGDVTAFDNEARKNKVKDEIEALNKLMKIYPEFGKELHDLWHESEKRETIEAKIAKAADAICPIFLRVQFKQALPPDITFEVFDKTKAPSFRFSKIFNKLYEQLKKDMIDQNLIKQNG